MAYVVADPEMMTAAASDLATIGSDLSAAHLAAAARTTSVIPAAADEVSAGIANLMSTHALDFQAMAQSASTFHQQFTHNIHAAAASYSSAESAAATKLTPTFPSLSDFFQQGQSDFAASIGNFANSFGSFPNLAWDQLGRAADDALGILLFPITYPITAVSVFVIEALLDSIVNAFTP
jgi:PE family